MVGDCLSRRKRRPNIDPILDLVLTLIGWTLMLIVPEKQPIRWPSAYTPKDHSA